MQDIFGQHLRCVRSPWVLGLLVGMVSFGLIGSTAGAYPVQNPALAAIKSLSGEASRFFVLLALSAVFSAIATCVFSRPGNRPAMLPEECTEPIHAGDLTAPIDSGRHGETLQLPRDAEALLCANGKKRSIPDQLPRLAEHTADQMSLPDLLNTAPIQKVLLHTMSEGMVIVNCNAEIVHVNPPAETILDSTQQRLQQQKLVACGWEFFAENGKHLENAKNPVVCALQDRAHVKDFRLKIRRSEANAAGDHEASSAVEKDLQANAAPLYDEHHRMLGALVMLRDVTTVRRQEQAHAAMLEHLRQREKLAALGQMAACVAHEINNPITGVINYAQLLLEKGIGTTDERALLHSIAEEGGRIAEIVSNLLDSARQEKQEAFPIALSSILDASLHLMCKELEKDGITLVREVPDDLPLVLCRGQQMQQVFINLLSNARDALNQKYAGSHANKILRICGSVAERAGQQLVRAEFYDSGVGIARDVLPKIFEPFFTTKEASNGTGLGLSVSYGIVKDNCGEMYVESVLGEYTRFSVELPAADCADEIGPLAE